MLPVIFYRSGGKGAKERIEMLYSNLVVRALGDRLQFQFLSITLALSMAYMMGRHYAEGLSILRSLI